MTHLTIAFNNYDNHRHQSYLLFNGLYYELATDTGLPLDSRWIQAPYTTTVEGNAGEKLDV